MVDIGKSNTFNNYHTNLSIIKSALENKRYYFALHLVNWKIFWPK